MLDKDEVAIQSKQPYIHAHPVVFMFLVLPFGVSSGYITVAFAFLFSRAGVPTVAVAALIGAGFWPQILKFLWAPLVDTTLSLKKWYVLSGIVTAATIFATGILPLKESSLPLLTIIVVVMNVASSFLGIAVNGLAAHDTPEHLKGRVSGYLNAGNLGGAGVGGGIGLLLAQNLSQQWISPAVLAVSCLLCCLGLFFIKEPQITVRTVRVIKTMQNVLKEVWDTIKARIGFLALLLSFLPLSTGAASNLWSAVSDGWHVSAFWVAIATGVASGLITAVGCLIGGWICDRMHKQNAYILFGVLQVLCALGMSYSPHTELMYIIWTSIYSLSLGFAYAGFSAFVFEAIGKGAAATKYTLYASLSNSPIYYMTVIEGYAYTKWGPKGMLNTEAACGVVGIILFLILLQFMKKTKQAEVTA